MKQLRLYECRGWMTDQINILARRQRWAREYPPQAQLWTSDSNLSRIVLVKEGPNFPRPPRAPRAWRNDRPQCRLGSSLESCQLIVIKPPGPRLAGRRQTRLGCSAANELVLVFTEPCLQERPEEKRILILPNELLLDIFLLTTKLDMLSLSVVCHRFHDLVTPLLYQSLELTVGWKDQPDDDDPYYSSVSARRSPLRLYRTLQQNSALRQHCRELLLSLRSPERIGYLGLAHAIDVVTWLENVVYLRLDKVVGEYHGYTAEEAWALIRAVAQQRKSSLQELHLGRYLGLRLIEVCHVLGDLPNLRVLCLEGVWEMGHILPQSAWKPDLSVSLSLTSLSIENYLDSGENLRRFLMLVPANLEHFTFIGSTDVGSEHRSSLTFPFVASALSPHMETIRTLVVNTYYVSSPIRADLSGFTRLKELTLSLSTTRIAKDYTREILTAPNIHKFRWVISDYFRLSLFRFGASEEDWLRCLAGAAAVQGSTLREIEVDWGEIGVDKPFWPRKPEIYPWDRLERLQRELTQGGQSSVSLHWSSPSIPKNVLCWTGWETL